MSFKKGLLTKFLSEPEDTEDSERDRSPVHNGRTWIIPETSSSEQEKEIGKKNEKAKNEEEEVRPSTSGFQTKGKDTSSSKSAIFKTDNSSVSPPTPPRPIPRRYILETSSKIVNETTTTTSNERTIPIMGTSLNPIEPPTSGSAIEISTTTDKSEESDINRVLTSTPVKGHQPPLTWSRIETSSGDNFSIPSSIFGSPSPMEIDDNSNYAQRNSSSKEEEEEVQRELAENLQRMKASLAKDQQKRKRKFFKEMENGELKNILI